MINKIFQCIHCHKNVSEKALGTANRNHCNFCLWSKHVDEKIGDRKSSCQGAMEPVGVTFKKNGELMLTYKCVVCSKFVNNRIAGDDNTDEIMKIVGRSKSSEKNKIKIKTQLFGN